MTFVTGARRSQDGFSLASPCNSFRTTNVAVGSFKLCILCIYETADKALVMDDEA